MGQINAIWARSEDFVIGVDGQLPWHSKQELAYFKKTTDNSIVIMGRKTWESLPPSARPLKGRRNIILSRDTKYRPTGATVMHSVDAIVKMVRAQPKNAWVIGGAEVYSAFQDHYDFISETIVSTDIGEGTMIEDFVDLIDYTECCRHDLSFEENGLEFDIIHYWRIKGSEPLPASLTWLLATQEHLVSVSNDS